MKRNIATDLATALAVTVLFAGASPASAQDTTASTNAVVDLSDFDAAPDGVSILALDGDSFKMLSIATAPYKSKAPAALSAARTVAVTKAKAGLSRFLNESVSAEDYMEKETTKVKVSSPDGGETFVTIPDGATVSMNMWAFNNGMMAEIESQFEAFLKKGIAENPMKCEFYLPEAVGTGLRENRLNVKVIPTPDRWYGVTYAEDKPALTAAIAKMKAEGKYPDELWS